MKQDANKTNAETTVGEVQKSIRQLKGFGCDVTELEDIFERAKSAFENGRYNEFINYIEQIKSHQEILLHNFKNEILENELNAKKVEFSELLKKSDFISVHVPLTEKTHHLIDEEELKMMKKSAVLINTSRGPVINEKTLIKALKEKWIFSAGLDVYENEPEINEELKKLDNVVLQPHSASATVDSRTNMAIIAAKNMIAGLKGEIPPNCVNKEVFQTK